METNVRQVAESRKSSIPKLIDPKKLQNEQISDPDYRLKFLENLLGTKNPISCSKCHHCR